MKFKLCALIAVIFLVGCGGLPIVENAPEKKSRSDSADVHSRLGWNYLKRGQYAVARTETERALAIDPKSSRANHVHGLLMIRLGEAELAESALRAAAKYAPDNLDIRQDLASFLCGQDRFDESVDIYQSVLDSPINQHRDITLTRAGLCLMRKQEPQKAERYLRQALESNPGIPAALSAMSQLAYRTGKFMKARAYLQRYHSVSPETAQTLAWGVLIESRLGDESAANEYGTRLKTAFPNSQQARQLVRSGQVYPQVVDSQ